VWVVEVEWESFCGETDATLRWDSGRSAAVGCLGIGRRACAACVRCMCVRLIR
jgi:hypothetical protein